MKYGLGMVARLLRVGLVGSCLMFASVAAAEEEPLPAKKPSAAVGQENFGFGASIGFYNPNGLILRAGARVVSVDVTAGFVPVLLSYGGNRDPSLKLIAPFEVTPQLSVELLTFPKEIRAGLRAGYRYNVDLGHGGTFGGQLSKRWGHVLLEGLWGITVYPKASDRLRGDRLPGGTEFNFPPELNYGLTVNLLYYP